MYGSSGSSCTTAVFLPPVHKNAPSKPNEYKSSPTPFPPHFFPPPGYGTYLNRIKLLFDDGSELDQLPRCVRPTNT